jgi:hypothetical protein
MSEEKVIWFKKQMLGKWRRDDGELKILVTEEEMNDEILKLSRVGCTVKIWGVTHTRMVEVIFPKSRKEKG